VLDNCNRTSSGKLAVTQLFRHTALWFRVVFDLSREPAVRFIITAEQPFHILGE